MGDDQASPSDAELMRTGRELSEAYVVSVRCVSCGAHGPPTMPDGFRHVVAKAFSMGYRMRELGREGCLAWADQASLPDRDTSGFSSPDLPPIVVEGDAARDRDERSGRVCELGLGEGQHAYVSADRRLWTCLCGAWIVGTKVTFAWPGSPLDGQTHVVTDAQLEELGRAGLVGVAEVLEASRASSSQAGRS